MKTRDITYQEIEEAINQIKTNKTPGEGQVTAEMLKADTHVNVKCLVALFSRWDK